MTFHPSKQSFSVPSYMHMCKDKDQGNQTYHKEMCRAVPSQETSIGNRQQPMVK